MQPRTLAGGLVLRAATEADAPALEAFNGRVHGTGDDPDTGLGAWTRDLVAGRHPSIRASDFLVVVEPRDSAVVSSLNLIAQRWTYDGVGFGVGQPELVGTDPAYRNRGLVREQFAVVHRWCEQRGLGVQAIGGIPWYYRQFGYEYALPGWGGRRLAAADAEGAAGPRSPTVDRGRPSPGGHRGGLRLRPAVAADAALLTRMSARADRRSAVACPRDEAAWRHEITGHSADSGLRQAVDVLETGDRAVGALVRTRWTLRGAIGILMLEIDDTAVWLDVVPAVLRHLLDRGREAAQGEGADLAALEFGLGEHHPAYSALPRAATPFTRDAWYIRVPDLVVLLRLLAPALERRLAASPAAGVTGDLLLSFYRSGLRLAFAGGRLAAVEPWLAPQWRTASAALPDLTFLKLLFGHRSLDQLAEAYPDVILGSDRARAVLDACFPRRSSTIWPSA